MGDELKIRIDLLIVNRKLAPSRTKAKELIEKGYVSIYTKDQWTQVETPSLKIDKDLLNQHLKINENELLKYVSRAGLKLERALQTCSINVKGMKVLDVGQSTGGFSHCLLENGANTVVGIDVGHGQIAPYLQSNEFSYSNKLEVIEGVNVKNLLLENRVTGQGPYDMVVADLAFISLSSVLEIICSQVKHDGILLALVKPQFELGSDALSSKGIVKDKALYDELELKVTTKLKHLQFKIQKYIESELKGRDGNTEFFIYGKKL